MAQQWEPGLLQRTAVQASSHPAERCGDRPPQAPALGSTEPCTETRKHTKPKVTKTNL